MRQYRISPYKINPKLKFDTRVCSKSHAWRHRVRLRIGVFVGPSISYKHTRSRYTLDFEPLGRNNKFNKKIVTSLCCQLRAYVYVWGAQLDIHNHGNTNGMKGKSPIYSWTHVVHANLAYRLILKNTQNIDAHPEFVWICQKCVMRA